MPIGSTKPETAAPGMDRSMIEYLRGAQPVFETYICVWDAFNHSITASRHAGI